MMYILSAGFFLPEPDEGFKAITEEHEEYQCLKRKHDSPSTAGPMTCL